jgi:glyoxylase-like metal-dependent hydrolase (beta-lactamase superfamily II)
MFLKVKEFFDNTTNTLTYIVYDIDSKDAIIIDPVLDYDLSKSELGYKSINELKVFLDSFKLVPHFSIETHVHADHFSGSFELKKSYPNLKIAVSDKIDQVQDLFANFFNSKLVENSFDLMLKDQEIFQAGTIKIKTIHTPGHTPACASFLIENFLFTGDALFMPDFGTGRCDFPEGSAIDLYHSIHSKLYKLPNETVIFTGHDYMSGNRELQFKSTIGESLKNNIHISDKTTEEEFVEFRTNRDKLLSSPKLLFPSIQVNINAGILPKEEDNGKSYLKIPINK